MWNKFEESDEQGQKSRVEKIVSLLTENLKGMIDTRMIVGEEIRAGEVMILPISKLSVGFVSGGGEYNKKSEKEKNPPFAGGSGAGYSVSPVGFVVVKDGDVKVIKVSPNELANKFVEVLPEVVDAINRNIKKN